MNLGYACLNTVLSKNKITTNRTMRRKTFDTQGLDLVSYLAIQNVKDLKTYIQWNNDNGIKLFRLSSQIFPWSDDYELSDLKDYNEICNIMLEIGEITTTTGQRLTMHPGQYCILTSPHQHVIDNSVSDLQMHSDLMDLMGLSRTHYNKINIHMGASYGDKESAIKTFLKNFNKLPDAIKSRLTIENDDKGNMYSTKELFEGIHKNANIPIVFDYHHHKFCTGGQSEEEALRLAVSTWGNIKPIVHYSESKALNESLKVKLQAHSDYYLNKVETYGLDLDIMMECKAKELAVMKYKKDFL